MKNLLPLSLVLLAALTGCCGVGSHLPKAPEYRTEDPAVDSMLQLIRTVQGTAGDFLKRHNGTLSVEEAQECLSLVQWKDFEWDNGMVEDTQYSCVYDQNDLILYIRSWSDYDNTVIFNLKP